MLKTLLLLLPFGLGTFGLHAQVIWSENFTYPNGTTIGANNNTSNPAPDWTSICPTCIPTADWFEVRSNRMEGRDTNGPAVLTTETIDISAHPIGVEFSVLLSEQGDLEGCPNGISSGCNSVDWISIEYNLDGAGYVPYSSPNGGPCAGACAGGTYVTIDDFGSFNFNVCPILGDSISFRISVQCWAANEYMRIENMVLQVQTCNPFVLNDSIVPVICNGGSDGEIWMDVTGAMPPYTYSLNGGPFQPTPSFTGLSAGTYFLVVRDVNGALDTLNGIVVPEPGPVSITDSVVNISCNAADDGQIWATNTTGGTPGYGYSLNGSPFQAGNSFSGLIPGTYTLITQDTNGCRDTVPNLQVIEPGILAFADSTVDASCNAASDGQIFGINVTGGTPGFNFSLNGGPFQPANNFTGLTPGTYSIVIQDTNGCSDTINNLSITEPAALSFSDSLVGATCNGSSDGEIWALNAAGGTPGYNYSLNGGTFQPANTFSGLSAGIYAIVLQDSNGCTDTLNGLAVTEPAPIQFNDSVVAISCTGAADGELWAINVVGGTPGYSYSVNGGAFQSGNSFGNLSAGTYSIVVQDTNGCRDTLANNVLSDPPLLVLSTSAINADCINQTGSATVVPNGGTPGYSYNWSSTPPQNTATATGLPVGTYYVTVTDSNGCTASDSAMVMPTPPPVVVAPPNDSVCFGAGGITLVASFTGGAGAGVWSWTCDNAFCALDSLDDDDPLADPAATTTYYVQFIDSFGCQSNLDSVTVSVLPLPTVSVSADTSICLGDSVLISGVATGGPGGAFTYQWSPANGLSNDDSDTAMASPAAPTTYYFAATAGGCQSLQDSVLVDILSPPMVFAGQDTVICRGDEWLLTALPVAPPSSSLTFEWYGPAGLLNPLGNDSVQVSPLQTTIYEVRVVAQPGCPSAFDSILVEVEQPFDHPVPESQIEFCPGEPLQIGVAALPGFSYEWTPRNGLQDPTVPLTMVAPEESASYNLQVLNDTMRTENCRLQTFPVALNSGNCLLPNVFSPNGDGINDVLDFGPYFHEIRLAVYDRWGKEVYSSNGYNNDWQGTDLNGNPLPEGVYYYVLHANVLRGPNGDARNRTQKMAGNLTLLR